MYLDTTASTSSNIDAPLPDQSTLAESPGKVPELPTTLQLRDRAAATHPQPFAEQLDPKDEANHHQLATSGPDVETRELDDPEIAKLIFEMRTDEARRELIEALQALAEPVAADKAFAKELYAALCNMRWHRYVWDSENAPLASVTWRNAGGIVADLEGRGGDYLDFYCSGNEGTVSERVSVMMESMGWVPVAWSPDYFARSQYLAL